MSASKYKNLDDLMDGASTVPEEMTGLKPNSRFAMAREAMNHQPNMPPIVAREVAAVLDLTPQKGLENSEYEVVPLDQIVENPFNARHHYDLEAIDKLALSMAADGQLQPGIATIRGGKRMILGGHYRFRALKKANIPTMKLIIRKDLSDQDLYRLSFKENDERHPQTAIDNAFAWKNLLEQKIYNKDSDIAEALGVSKAMVSKTLAIGKLSSTVIEFANANPTSLGVSLLYELQQLEEISGPEQTLKMAQAIVDGHAKRDDITKLRVKLATSKTRKPHDTSRQYKLKSTAGQVGTMKESTNGRVVIDVKITNPEERQAFLDELRKRFDVS